MKLQPKVTQPAQTLIASAIRKHGGAVSNHSQLLAYLRRFFLFYLHEHMICACSFMATVVCGELDSG